MQPRVLSYVRDAEQLWLGSLSDGTARKVFKLVSAELTQASRLVAGVTMFHPGESSSFHHHPGCEEVNFVLAGSGVLVSDDDERPFDTGDVVFIPDGQGHQHRNDGDEPLIIGWTYAPQAELPTT